MVMRPEAAARLASARRVPLARLQVGDVMVGVVNAGYEQLWGGDWTFAGWVASASEERDCRLARVTYEYEPDDERRSYLEEPVIAYTFMKCVSDGLIL